MRNLTAKEEIFAQVYARTGNATLAYSRAGYSLNMSPKNINSKAYGVKSRVEVRDRIEEILNEKSKDAVVDFERCNRRLMNIIKTTVKDMIETVYDEEKDEFLERLKKPSEIDIDSSDAIKKVKYGKNGELEYEFFSPIDAIKQLASINTDRNIELEYKLLENMLDKMPDETIDKIAHKVKEINNLRRIENG